MITGYFMKDGLSAVGWHWKIGLVVLGIFWVIMLYNCMQRKFKANHDKIAWVIVIVFLKFLGAFIYLFWILQNRKKKK